MKQEQSKLNEAVSNLEEIVATLQREKKDSIVVKKNAKGEYTYDHKIYYNSDDGDEEIMKRLIATDAKLREAFP